MHCNYCEKTSHTRDTCWDLVGQPSRVSIVFVVKSLSKRTSSGETTKSKMGLNITNQIQALKQEIQVLSRLLRTLEGIVPSNSYYANLAFYSTSGTAQWLLHLRHPLHYE